MGSRDNFGRMDAKPCQATFLETRGFEKVIEKTVQDDKAELYDARNLS
jgi:hypothetical protein